MKHPMKICFTEESDGDFIRWTSNLFRTFLQEGRIAFVRQTDSPDAMIASVWRKHEFPSGLPVILLTNENWSLFQPHAPLRNYKAVLGLYPPSEPCRFIQFPYAAVHFDVPIEELYALRKALLKTKKTRFCCFVASGTIGQLAGDRVALFQRIDGWKRVHSAGRLANNVNYLAPRGVEFLQWISRFQYMICLENSREPDYITEKPFQAWFAGTVPIYDGGCADQLNQGAIVNASKGDVLSQLEALEAQPDAYEAKRHADLCDRPVSLESFEQQFRRLMNEWQLQ
jgi:hypothetical protein